MDDRRLVEARLRDLATHLEWGDEADLLPAVRRRLSETAGQGRRVAIVRAVAVAAAILVIVLAIPAGREAVADLLGLAGIEIRFSSTPAPGAAGELDLGEAVTLAEAVEEAPFPVLVASHPDLGMADLVYVDPGPPLTVSLAWRGDDTLPAAGSTGIAFLHSQFAPADEAALRKELPPETEFEAVAVRGGEGRWIEGAAHRLEMRGGDGSRGIWRVRLAANVLIWQEGIVTHRIETSLSLEQTLEIVSSLRPVQP